MKAPSSSSLTIVICSEPLDDFWLVRDGKLSEFDGDLDEYA